MRRTVFSTLLVATVVTAPALAQRQVTPPAGLEDTVEPPPGGLALSKQGRVVMASDLCTRLARAKAAAPGAEYRPGVDVNGDAVAPADLPAAPAATPENFPIEIGPPLQRRYGVAGAALFHGKTLGVVTMHDGRAYLNGEPLRDGEREMMLAACREATPKR